MTRQNDTSQNSGGAKGRGLGKDVERALSRLKVVDRRLRAADEHISRARDSKRAAGAQ